MNTLKKFSVETHKGWASFQAWIKKWNKIMAVIFSALGITLLLSTVIVNALEVHEENQEQLKLEKENPRLNLFEVCKQIRRDKCSLHCSCGNSTDISRALNHHWEKTPYCHSNGMTVEISSTVYFPTFTIPADWLNGHFKLRELQVDVENIFEIRENAFVGTVFEWIQKLVLINLHLHSTDTMVLKKLFVVKHYDRLTITKNNSSNELTASATVELHAEPILYSETDMKNKVQNPKKIEGTTLPGDGNRGRALIVTVTIVSCILSFSLGLLIRYNLFERKVLLKDINKANSVVFVVEHNAADLRESVFMHNEKRANKILSTNP